MEKKVIRYFIIFLVVPIIISIIIALATNNKKIGPSESYDSISGTNGKSDYFEYEEEIENNNVNPIIYMSLFILVMTSVGVWVYVKKKGEL